MTTASPEPQGATAGMPDAAPPFASILCGIDGSRTAYEAARQAAILAGAHGRLTLMAVTWQTGVGLAETADLGHGWATAAIEEATRIAKQAGARPETVFVERRRAADALLAAAPDHDLIALGGHGYSRAGGIFLGSTTSAAVHRATSPVLVARRRATVEFPTEIIVASDGTPSSRRAVQLAGQIARSHGARVSLVHAEDHDDGARRHAQAEEITELIEVTGVEPSVIEQPQHTVDAIVTVAERENAALIVIGSRGRHGVAALASISERVAHRATCSVLVARPPGERS